MQKKQKAILDKFALRSTRWIGSTQSLALHTVIFIASFLLYFLGIAIDTILLVLTTIVSLEAIYLAIFIQMSVNRQASKLSEVSEDIDEIQEDIEGIEKDIDEIQEDVEDIQEDVEEIEKDIDDIQEDVEEISNEEDEIIPVIKTTGNQPILRSEEEIILLLKNLDNKIADLQKELKASQKEKASLAMKPVTLKQRVTKLLKK